MSGKEFFVNRYSELGWKNEEVEPRQTIRINTPDRANAVVERLSSLGLELEKIPFLENGYWVCKSKFSIGATPEYLLGLYSIQEAASQIPVTLFTELKEKVILDACAAPGGKTVQLAVLIRNTGVIIALDVRKKRLRALSNQLERCHVKNTIVYRLDATQARKLDVRFDCVLLDLPCSGNFVIDKRWFGRRTIKDVKKNAAVQRRILAEATGILKDQGEIVYSTCSLEPEEDEFNVDWAVNNLNLKVQKINCFGEKGLTDIFGQKLDDAIQNCRRMWPGQTQGFFVCKLKRGSSD